MKDWNVTQTPLLTLHRWLTEPNISTSFPTGVMTVDGTFDRLSALLVQGHFQDFISHPDGMEAGTNNKDEGGGNHIWSGMNTVQKEGHVRPSAQKFKHCLLYWILKSGKRQIILFSLKASLCRAALFRMTYTILLQLYGGAGMQFYLLKYVLM